MVNQSKASDPRFWATWKKAGAVGEIITINTLVERLQQKGFQQHEGIPIGIPNIAGYLGKDIGSFMLPANGSADRPKNITIREQEGEGEVIGRNKTFRVSSGDYMIFYSDRPDRYIVGYFNRLGMPFDKESKEILARLFD